MTASAIPLEALLARFQATYPIVELRHGGETWLYRRGGSGDEPVLWLTGALGVGESAFAPILALGSGFRVLAPDYPPIRTLERMTDGLVAILDAEGVGSAHVVSASFGGMVAQALVRLVSASFGGMVAQALVRRHPQRVRSLVLSHTTAPDGSRSRVARVRILSLLLPDRLYRALFRRRFRGAFAEADPFWLSYFDSTVAGLANTDLTSRVLLAAEFLAQTGYGPRDLEAWPGRILILDADDDPLMPPPMRAALRALYPQAEVHAFSGTGHLVAILHPERYAEVIRRFLSASAAQQLDEVDKARPG